MFFQFCLFSDCYIFAFFQFNIILILIIIVEMAGLILAFVFTTDVEKILRESAITSITTLYGTSGTTGTAVTQAWDFTHAAVSNEFNCTSQNLFTKI